MFSPRRFIAIAKKEYLELKRNKLFFIMTVLAPTILYFLFAFGFSLDARNVPIGIIDQDNSMMSRKFIDRFVGATDVFKVKEVSGSYSRLEREMDLDRIRAIIVIPPDFSANIMKNRPVTLQFLLDGVNPVYINIVSAYIQSIAGVFQYEVLAEYFAKTQGAQSTAITPIELSVSAWYNSSFRSEDFVIPGVVAIVIMFFPPLVSAISLAKEKETGSILNMYCSSITKTEYLLGKMVPYIIIGFLNAVLFLAFTIFLFGVPMRGNIFVLLIVTLFYVSAAIAVGLLVAVILNSQVAAIIITSILTLTPSFMYSGFMVPVSSLTGDAKIMAYLSPATFYIDIARKIMVKGAQFANIINDALIIVCFAAALYLLCIMLFKKRIG